MRKEAVKIVAVLAAVAAAAGVIVYKARR